MEINSYSVKYADREILEASCGEEKKIYSEFEIGHAEFKRGMRVWIIRMWVVELKVFHIFFVLRGNLYNTIIEKYLT